jgi:hypothetical protein
MTYRLSVSLPDPVYNYVAAEAAKLGIPVSEVFRRWATDEYARSLSKQEASQPKPKREYHGDRRDQERTIKREATAHERARFYYEAAPMTSLERSIPGMGEPVSEPSDETWEEYLEGLYRRGQEAIGNERWMHDAELDLILKRRRKVYEREGIEPPELPAHLTATLLRQRTPEEEREAFEHLTRSRGESYP